MPSGISAGAAYRLSWERVVPRELWQAKNRELFREVNDRIAAIAKTLGSSTDTFTFTCECSQWGCTTQIDASLQVYARVREQQGAYLVVAGHEEAAEDTIFGHDSYRIVLPRTSPRPAVGHRVLRDNVVAAWAAVAATRIRLRNRKRPEDHVRGLSQDVLRNRHRVG